MSKIIILNSGCLEYLEYNQVMLSKFERIQESESLKSEGMQCEKEKVQVEGERDKNLNLKWSPKSVTDDLSIPDGLSKY